MQGSIPPAVEFHPTAAQFSEPLAYIASIAEEGAKYGACKIVPPPEWKPSSYRPSYMLPTKQQKVRTAIVADISQHHEFVPSLGFFRQCTMSLLSNLI